MSPSPRVRTLLKAASILGAVALLAAGATALWLRSRVAASLPTIDGAVRLRGLSAPVTIRRDAQGVPVIEGANRMDVARATGWVHAQDRFFQMDLMRRRGAGELSELFGKVALNADRAARMHGFRDLARRVLEREPPERRALAQAYAEGVNEGLASLKATPWEYALLRASPRPWAAEDSALVIYAMVLDLQEPTGRFVRTLAAIRNELGPASLAFFSPVETPDDAALDASTGPLAPLPPPKEVDLRRRRDADATASLRDTMGSLDWESIGSNNFAVSGALTGGPALVADDMHLHLGVPNIWYRARLRWPGHDETGVTLPGGPMIVAGSNGKVAWGFTNSHAATSDVVIVDPGPDTELYHGLHGTPYQQYETRHETVLVHGSKPVDMEFKWTIWGPVVGDAGEGRALVMHWTEDDPSATNFGILGMEEAADVRQAIEVGHRMGIPVQNLVVADSTGQIAWTIAGLLPKRVGYDGRLPVKWSFGDRRWDGYLQSTEVPAVINPPSGRIWTANNRTVGGDAMRTLGDSGFSIPARAAQIRDDLAALGAGPVSARDLLSVQLDDRALLLAPWHDLLLSTLNPAAVAAKSSRAQLLEASRAWEGHAAVGSTSYRITRSFRLAVARRVFNPIFDACADACPDFNWARLNYEGPLWAILKARPPHLLDSAYADWNGLLLAAVDDVSQELSKAGVPPSKATWGEANRAVIEHPLARALPRWLSGWLRMPGDPQPGDAHMPRVMEQDHGASERFAVAPGREAEGVFEMPGGECANPLSPFYAAGHEAWVLGQPTPFLPGPAAHTVTLSP